MMGIRAVLGTIIAGPIGAMVGAISGIGQKEIRDGEKYFFIEYTDKENSDKKTDALNYY